MTIKSIKSIKSPLSLSLNTEKLRDISSDEIIRAYKKRCGIDVSSFLNFSSFGLFKCLDTQYKFFYPRSLAGDSEFYEQLMEFDWYYMKDKWEHIKTLQLLDHNDTVLEVGSGAGYFLETLRSNNYTATGLELNKKTVENCVEQGLYVLNQTVEEHSNNYNNYYSVVCSYQVLEHIFDVHSFIKSNVKCLKKGGRLIISVPNNNSFIRYASHNIFNLPPHHMGLWDENSLKKIEEIFNVKMEKVFKEPLQDYHVDWYTQILLNRFVSNNKVNLVINVLGISKLMKFLIMKLRNFIKGHSILVVYKKI